MVTYANLVPKINPEIDIVQRDNEYIVTLTESNFHFKISTQMFNLLKLVDNRSEISQIVTRFNKKFETQLDNELVYELLYNKLGNCNIIENKETTFNVKKQPSYLKLNFIVINAKTAKIISEPFLFLFSNKALKFLITISLLITSLTFVLNYDEIVRNIKNVSFEYFTLYFAIMVISSLFHELGHVSATYKFGGSHSGIGVGFYLFTPVLYADVSSAWKFDVNKRIIVNLAGIYFELLLGTLLVIIGIITAIKPLLIISSIILFKTLYNLNPFFRTDGYWVLSDYIRTPNLREKSNGLLKKIIKNKFVIEMKQKDFFLLVYALISNSFIVIFLFYLFILNPNSLITFPVDIFTYATKVINREVSLSMSNVSHLLIPVVFYMLLIRLLFNYFKKQK
ncbi:putative peptide zinc metalloprotease protein [Flavobacterium resistens]|uniref:Putative peptide zinc metalloprotease protein n=1 Tax=Flavobacterium resistens TaxID=443612 RepID=A0A521F0Q1_9FLAO|nr:hypothetical protein [Flavobacterium resistens]MRX69329.1 hypothetical protein [Flavobacterium resistens]SMO89241.1 putative peptide zinc metalloprotease protein [Flavobacterium resistens]